MNNSIVTFGEIMLRLSSPHGERLLQSPKLDVSFGGAEANVAVLLSELGISANYVSVIAKNEIGKSSLRELARYGVATNHCLQKNGRQGVYYLEYGADQRSSKVVYDRAGSCFALMSENDFDWKNIFSQTDASWFHTTGITPAVSKETALACTKAISEAKKAGLTVSLDINYRKKLWQYGEVPPLSLAPQVMSPLVSQIDVLIANEEDIQCALGISVEGLDSVGGVLDESRYLKLLNLVVARYPNLKTVAITLRESFSADRNRWSAILYHDKKIIASKKYVLEDIVDRVGAGDSFAAGLIYGLMKGDSDFVAGTSSKVDGSDNVDAKKILNFAVAAAVLKHTIKGDFNLATKEEIEKLAQGEESGRVDR